MRIEENIGVVREVKGWRGKEMNKGVEELMEMVGVDAGMYGEGKG
ncbi:hypothetical protein [Bacillus pumilus]|nr:hypothetical protein [Bacillus pumilus]